MKAKYVKTVLTVTVLSPHDGPCVENMDLDRVASAIDTGDLIGQVEVTSVVGVPVKDIKKELIAIGNDGLFFGARP